MAAQPMAPVSDPSADPASWLRAAGFVGTLRTEACFADLCTYRLGGPIRLLAEPDSLDDLLLLRDWLDLADSPPQFFLGGGTNLLASSAPWPGLVLRLGTGFREIRQPAPDRLVIGAAVSTGAVLRYCLDQTLGGLGVLSGVPGTLGGAVAMNAGTMKDWLDPVIIEVVALDPDWQLHHLTAADCGFRYRGSMLLDRGWRVLETTFAVTPGVSIRDHLAQHLAMRRKTQPPGRNAGSNFRNPPGHSAGQLIDSAGCKSWREGGAIVSDLHANFILAESGCTPEDVYRLMQRVARRVAEVHGVRLDPEVVLLNFPRPWTATWEQTEGKP